MIREMLYRGSFYPHEVGEIREFIESNSVELIKEKGLRGLIVPHAGWIYSGYTALKGYCRRPEDEINTILLLGPSHRVPFNGAALSNFNSYDSPFDPIEIDRELNKEIQEIDGIRIIDDAHIYEHSLEVQIPFIKKFYPNVKLLPVVVGSRSEQATREILLKAFSTKGVFTIISSDLSHYHSYNSAVDIDSETIKSIRELKEINSENACGAAILNPLIKTVKSLGKKINLIDYTNSGDTAGERSRVVGYCSMEVVDG